MGLPAEMYGLGVAEKDEDAQAELLDGEMSQDDIEKEAMAARCFYHRRSISPHFVNGCDPFVFASQFSAAIVAANMPFRTTWCAHAHAHTYADPGITPPLQHTRAPRRQQTTVAAATTAATSITITQPS